MANRRKFIAGLGALATGSAAAMGTGAFSFANAERDIQVSVADDASAFLALTEGAENDEYVDTSGNQISLDFNGDAGTNGGSGINPNSDYRFDDVFRVTNQGTQGVGLWFNDFQDSETPSASASQDGPVQWYIRRLDNNGDVIGGLIGAGDNGSPPDLDVGETVAVCPAILLRNNSYSDLPDNVSVYVDKSGYDGEA